MNKKDEDLLKKCGWTVECENPMEIRHEDGSFASEQAAQYVLVGLRDEEEESREACVEEISAAIDNLRQTLDRHGYDYNGESLDDILDAVLLPGD